MALLRINLFLRENLQANPRHRFPFSGTGIPIRISNSQIAIIGHGRDKPGRESEQDVDHRDRCTVRGHHRRVPWT